MGLHGTKGPPRLEHPLGKEAGDQQGSRGPLPGECPQGEAPWVTQAPSGSMQSKGTDVPPRPSHLGPGRADVFPGGTIPRTPKAHPGVPHGLAPKPPASPASGAGPDDSPRSRTRVGRRWLGRGMVRAEGARPGAMLALGSQWGLCWVINLWPHGLTALIGERPPGQPLPLLMRYSGL